MNGQLLDWGAVDDWWELAGTRDTELLVDLEALLDALTEQWQESQSCFDYDPLCADWRDDGPLRTAQEENWSQWLAHLCHTAPTRFITEVFDVHVPESPDRVQCEVPLNSDAEHDRRADILIQYPDTGISIEVKIDDEHYGKTPETADLIERHDRNRTWNHYLLLPHRNDEQLRTTLPSKLDDTNGTTVLRGTQPTETDVTVLHWRDISRALRRTLLTDPFTTHHWEATAYPFITTIETVLCQFAPQPLIATHTTGESIGFADQLQLRTAPLTEQHDYLTSTHE